MKKIVVSILIIMEGIFLFLSYKSFTNIPKENEVEEIKILENKEIPSSGFAYLIENNSGGFEESPNRDAWPDANYIFSGVDCYDETGPVTDADVSYNEESHQFTVKTKDSLFCYLKFAKKTSAYGALIANGKGQLEEETNRAARGDNILRYQGTNDTVKNNYICIGTNDKTTCTGNKGTYMYRIIGIVREDNTTRNEKVGQIKVIKKEALDTKYAWHSYSGDDSYTWGKPSALNTGINGTYFLAKATYGLSTQVGTTGKTWADDVIAPHTWPYADVSSLFSSGYNESTNAQTLYTNEVRLWTTGGNRGTSTNKIGLMYVHDYPLATSNNALCYYSNRDTSEYTKCLASWIHLSNNESKQSFDTEYTMSRKDKNGAWFVSFEGYEESYSYLAIEVSVRPVFYLQSTVQLTGTGLESDPFRITTV